MTTRLRRIAVPAGAVALLAVTPAVARAPITVTTKDPSPTVITRPALVSPRQVIRIREDAMTPVTPVRFKVYPDTSEFKPTSSRCQGQFFTRYVKTRSNHKVTITLAPRKPLCSGVLYQAEALIGKGDVPDKFAHLCVRGAVGSGAPGCEDNPYYFG